ncbi:condensation domain-containing protein [Micromonospora sp. WMMD882]|uniref:condensation domain-containing protein n=1 Tax=Micromonospora sp. WMMD882 TaxID=3015151 RepID=UPI00248A9F08|nr:condensation domain-containing protein [Micromonospora sp. WMMD882]WBB80489.1 condensation domain-containing protein [Micromonospora sp. WMMD882]
MTTTETTIARRTARVPFVGDRSGRWPMAYSQSNVFDWLPYEGSGAVFVLHVDLPTDCALSDVLDAVGVLVSRHEGLRTVYDTGDGDGRTQQVSGSGHVDVLLLELGPQAHRRTGITDPPRPFDHGGEYPVRMAVTTDAGRPVRAVFEFSHAVADLVGAGVLLDEFVALVASPADRTVGPPRWQPADQAEYERTPEARQRMAKTLAYWRDQLHVLPACLLSVPARREGPPEYQLATLRSVPVAAALRTVAKRARVTPATALVTTMATLLSWWTDTDLAALDALYSNRSLPRMRDFVGSIAQSALIPFAPAATFHQTLWRSHLAIFNSYQHAYFDATAVAELVETVGVRQGCQRHRDLVINDMSTTRGGVFDGRAGIPVRGTEVESGLAATTTDPVRLTILQTEPVAVLGLTHDVRHVTGDEAAGLLWALERILTTAAERDFDLTELGAVAGLDRVVRGDGWVKVNSSWIDLVACGRALREAAGDPAARVFVRDAPGGVRSLVGCAAPPDRRIGPRELHAATVAGLGGRHGAIAPDYYLVCARPPERPDDQAAWQAQPLRTAGAGR